MTHLIYLHQGHTAVPSYLNQLAMMIEPILEGEAHIGQANQLRTSTMWGLEYAAEIAFDEIVALLSAEDSQVSALSLVGVSLGGCILEKVAQKLQEMGPSPEIEFRYFIAIASPLNGITVGWNLPTLASYLLGWFDTTLRDLSAMHNKKRGSVAGLAMFGKRMCIANLQGDWCVPLTSALPIGGMWSWSEETRRLEQNAIDGSSCIWYAIVVNLTGWRIHHTIVTDHRVMNAIRTIVETE